MANPNNNCENIPQDNEQNLDEQSQDSQFLNGSEEDEEEYYSDQDYYDPEDDLAYFHDQKLRIEESWIEWERQSTVNNRQNPGNYRYNIFQKPGSAKRRERRNRSALAQINRPGSASGSASGSESSSSTAALAAAEKLRQLGSYRPALASSLVHSYSNLSWEATQAAREKRLAAKSKSDDSGQNIICTIPIELLSHIVSHLDPYELFNVSLVCQLFYHIVNADSCWKNAFKKFFSSSIPFKRLDPKSWRGEYIRRTRLLRRWEKGRGQNTLIDPTIGQISRLWADTDSALNEDWFLAGSINQGVVAKCDPANGKVKKDVVCRTTHFIPTDITTMAMDRRRVVWGLSTGEIAYSTLWHAGAGQTFQMFTFFHNGPVSCIKIVPGHLEFVLTGGVDGVVKLYNVAMSRCVYEFRTEPSINGNVRGRIDFICCDPRSYVVAGTSRGEIYVWNVDINSIITPPLVPSESASTSTQQNNPTTLSESPIVAPMTPKVVSLSEEPKSLAYLEVDFGMHGSGLILARLVDSTVMHIYHLETLVHLATLKSPAHFTPISAVHWDSPRYEKPMISLSNGTRRNSGTAIHGRQDLPSLLVTGDISGNICLWYLGDHLKRIISNDKNQKSRGAIELQPICAFKGHDTTVTSLFMDKLVIVSGDNDGCAKTWNPINGRLISVLNTGYIRNRENNGNSNAINCIAVNTQKSRGVLSTGSLIMYWDFSPEAGLYKDKNKSSGKKPTHNSNYNGGIKNKIQNDIRSSVEETVSLQRLEAQTKMRREQLHRRYNNLEGLNMVDMTDEEIVAYVMMLSKEHDDNESAQEAMELQLAIEAEEQSAWLNMTGSQLSNEGESSSAARSRPEIVQSYDKVTEKELEEEEELVRRAIALSMLDEEGSSSDVHSSLANEGFGENHIYTPYQWESSNIVDVDALGNDQELLEDQSIVDSILQELEETNDEGQTNGSASEGAASAWPALGKTQSTDSSNKPVSSPSPQAPIKISATKETSKMTWSMIARANSDTSISTALAKQPAEQDSLHQPIRQQAVIKQYPQNSSQEEIEDEDTLLARILSLSMVEK